MKVTLVSLRATEAANAAGRPALTPELLAATGARYSRSNEGLDTILGRIDPDHLDRSVDSIFRMIDYGHQSIADMAPVAMFIDGISIWLAYYIWSICPTAGGQESSTRYIRLSLAGVLEPQQLGIQLDSVNKWRARMAQAFAAYEQALHFWESVAERSPDVVRIPSILAKDDSDKAAKQRARMRRNYAFDRARNFIPSAAATNLMLVMSARGWVNLCQHLLSHPLQEPRSVGASIQGELALSAPRLHKHATFQSNLSLGLIEEFDSSRALAASDGSHLAPEALEPAPAGEFLEAFPPTHITSQEIAANLRHHEHRYAWIGKNLQRTAVRFGWEAVGFAEIRDLNRHRTGTKFSPLVPVGFYFASDQIPQDIQTPEVLDRFKEIAEIGVQTSTQCRKLLREGDPTYVYSLLLGTQVAFEHTTTADKFIYEAELRTGTGAHFRYAQHLRDVLKLWYVKFPETRGLILEGSAEPE